MERPELKEYDWSSTSYNSKPGDIRYNPSSDRMEYLNQSRFWVPMKLEDFHPPYIPEYKIKPDMPGYVDKLGSHYRWEDIIDTLLALLIKNGLLKDIEQFKLLLHNKMNAKTLAEQISEME